MQYNTKLLTLENIEDIKTLYNEFVSLSLVKYKFENPALDFEGIKVVIANKILDGIILYEENQPVAFLIYSDKINEAIEINIIHCTEELKRNTYTELLLKEFDNINHTLDTVSYPMMGVQKKSISKAQKLGYKFVSQSIVSFSFDSIECLKKLKDCKPSIKHDFIVKDWDENFIQKATELVFDSFSDSTDKFFDPRFNHTQGIESIITGITNNEFGVFVPSLTKLLTLNNQLLGICFVTLSSPNSANIPIICIKSDLRNTNAGRFLLQNTLLSIAKQIQDNTLKLFEINATLDTSNTSAFKMYESVGFKDEMSYPHAYKKL